MRYLHVPARFHLPKPTFRLPFKFIQPAFTTSGSRSNGTTRAGQRGAARTFAMKFYDILSVESSEIITWTESGKAFVVVDYERFSDEILQKYFRHNKFSSFRRQLNLYGYRKVIKGPDAGAYMHPSFQRGRPDLLPEVKKGKVPHYEMHGTNEIHGQHFRHHPPPENRSKRESAPPPTTAADRVPDTDSPVPRVTPEIRASPAGAEAYAPQARVQSGASPAAIKPGSGDEMLKFSHMSLSSLRHEDGWPGERSGRNEPGPNDNGLADSLTLTPAWGGRPMGEDSKTGGAAGDRSSGGSNTTINVGSSQGSTMNIAAIGQEIGRTPSTPDPKHVAYWQKNRSRHHRGISSQVVYASKLSANETQDIQQPDPNMNDVMDALWQCIQVLSSSSNNSQASTASDVSFKRDSGRRSSFFDLISAMSWESANRVSPTGVDAEERGSLAGAMEAALAECDEEDPRENDTESNSTLKHSQPLWLERDRSHLNGNAVSLDSESLSKHPDCSDRKDLDSSTVPQGRPSFDPNRIPSTGPLSHQSRGDCENECSDMDGGVPSSQTPHLSSSGSRNSAVSRIFPVVQTSYDRNSGQWPGTTGVDATNGASEDGGGAWEAGTANAQIYDNLHRVSRSSSLLMPPVHNQPVHRLQQMPSSAFMGHDSSPPDGTAIQRPGLKRLSSLTWLKEPKPERRPTITESHELNRMLANPEHLATWQRLNGDSDSISVLTSIGSYVG